MRTTLSFVFSLILFVALKGQAGTPASNVKSEYQTLRAHVAQLTPEFEVGGYLKGKAFGDYKLLWRLSSNTEDHEVIRIYRDKGRGQQALEVAYHRSSEIEPGRRVIRRFIGPAATGWRSDTIDADSGVDLGQQGPSKPYLDGRDLEILKEWGIAIGDDR